MGRICRWRWPYTPFLPRGWQLATGGCPEAGGGAMLFRCVVFRRTCLDCHVLECSDDCASRDFSNCMYIRRSCAVPTSLAPAISEPSLSRLSMAPVRKLSLLVLTVSVLRPATDAFSVSFPATTHPFTCSTTHKRGNGSSLEMQARNGDEQEGRRKQSESLSRGGFVRAAGTSALTFAAAAARGATPPASAVGEQPGERTTAPPPATLLVPALRAKLATKQLLKLLDDPAKWGQAREALTSPPLAPADFKECFRTYSDADPEQHLAFDLYRIQAQDALKAVSELLAYFASEQKKGSKIDGEDIKDLDEAGRSVLQAIDDFLKLAPREDVLMVEKNTTDQARTQAERRPAAKAEVPAGTRELEGAVAGEGAFVAGTWVGT